MYDPDYNLGQFHDGYIKMSLKYGLPIIPVSCHGTQEILPDGKLVIRVPRKERYVKMICHEPIYPDTNYLTLLDLVNWADLTVKVDVLVS